ncbi:hypothetical protein [Vampirovibrio chlorellavorus]|uniref:hypothetical protein n=1 Tax=Vampirovibrio chlorellavorus TaxID=758823 RepID=UPI0026F271F3|nr:hypothetical protein [Vampirovibrio chlorellavorus]
MTHVCYSLQEAADKLKLTETVLVRLSQFFKMPRAAYEASGYLSFKGDLAFTEPDLQFFLRVKERLLMGDTLEMVKRHLSSLEALGPSMTSAMQGDAEGVTPNGGDSLSASASAGSSSVPQPPMREIQDRQPYEKAAEDSFERYKSVHRTGLGRVFESMLKEVGATALDHPDLPERVSPPAPKAHAGTGAEPKNKAGRFSPFLPLAPEKSSAEPSEPATGKAPVNKMATPPPRASQDSASLDASWEQLLQQAVQHPRVLNSHLKSAAALLRERATRQDAQAFRKNS